MQKAKGGRNPDNGTEGWGGVEGGADMIARKEFQCERILISDMDINDDSN